MDIPKEILQKLTEEFTNIISKFLSEIDDKALYIVFEKTIAEMNRRKEKEQKENGNKRI